MIRQLKLIWSRRDLIKYFLRTELKIRYKHKLLGFLWTLLDPLMMMLVYIVLVVFIFKRGGPQFPVLLFSALLSWQWFTVALSKSVVSITSKVRLIQTIYFPKVVLPLSHVLLGLINYLLGLIVLVPFLFIFEARLTWNIFWLPVLIFLQLILTIGLSLFVATMGVYFRDLENILRFGLRIWFYLSPALYSVTDRIPEKYVSLYMLNPFSAIFNSYKNILVRGQPPSIYMLVFTGAAVVLFISGMMVFDRKEVNFAKDA
jgi:lipopolysaccharide transport system permease protein